MTAKFIIPGTLPSLPPPNPDYVPLSTEEKEKRKQELLSRLAANGRKNNQKENDFDK
jgi:hypothetical protein